MKKIDLDFMKESYSNELIVNKYLESNYFSSIEEKLILEYSSTDFLQEDRTDDFWIDQKTIWDKNLQNLLLTDFGDIIVNQNGQDIFIHIPNLDDFRKLINESGLQILKEYSWKDLYEDNYLIKEAQKCYYWIIKK